MVTAEHFNANVRCETVGVREIVAENYKIE